MQHFRNDTPQKSLALILSIVLHIVLFLLFIYFQWPKTVQEPIQSPDAPTVLPEPAMAPEVAALKTRASQFGAPVIFQEEPTFTPPDSQKDQGKPESQPQQTTPEP